MKKIIRNYSALVLALIVVSGVFFLFGSRKEGLFIDEVYTYGLSNSYYAPFAADLKDGDMIDKIMTREELFDYLTVGEDDRFSASSVYDNQTRDVHPPLYYWLFNFASSLNSGVFSFWTGLVLDYILYLFTLIALYALIRRLFENRALAVAGVILYGLSVIGMSTAIMIRMYVLLTLETVLLALLIVCIMREAKPWHYFALALTIFAGLMTQYYYVFYAFTACLAFDLHALCKKQRRKFFAFSAAALVGALCLLPAFPACLKQLFADALVSGGSAVDNLGNTALYASRLTTFLRDTLHRMKAAVYIAGASLAAMLLCFGKLRGALKNGRIRFDALVLILPALFTFLLVAVISPVAELRYIYNLIPMLITAVCFLLHLLERSFEDSKKKNILSLLALALIFALSLWEARCLPPDYLYDEYSDYDALLTEHSSAPCVYMDDNFSSPITYDMLQLMIFDDFLVTNDPSSEALAEYLGDAEESVVFVDISKDWASGYDGEQIMAELLENTEFDDYAPLYSNGFSAVYLMRVEN